MVVHEEGFPEDTPIDLGGRRSAFINLSEPSEGPSYGADDYFSDFSSLDKVKGGAHRNVDNVYMNVNGTWYYVTGWDNTTRDVYLIQRGRVTSDDNSRFIVSAKERHLTRVR